MGQERTWQVGVRSRQGGWAGVCASSVSIGVRSEGMWEGALGVVTYG